MQQIKRLGLRMGMVRILLFFSYQPWAAMAFI